MWRGSQARAALPSRVTLSRSSSTRTQGGAEMSTHSEAPAPTGANANQEDGDAAHAKFQEGGLPR